MGRSKTLPRPLAHINQSLSYSRLRNHLCDDCWRCFYFVAWLCVWSYNSICATRNNHYHSNPGSVYGSLPGCAILLFTRAPGKFQRIVAYRCTLIPFIVLIFPILAQFIPAPAAPLNLAGPIVAAWFIIGLVIVVILSLRSPEALASSHKIYIEDEGSPQPAH